MKIIKNAYFNKKKNGGNFGHWGGKTPKKKIRSEFQKIKKKGGPQNWLPFRPNFFAQAFNPVGIPRHLNRWGINFGTNFHFFLKTPVLPIKG